MQTLTKLTANIHAQVKAYFSALLAPQAAADYLTALGIPEPREGAFKEFTGLDTGQLVLFRAAHHNAAENFQYADMELIGYKKPFGVIINQNDCKMFIFLYFTEMKFVKGVLKYKIDAKFANEIGLNWDGGQYIDTLKDVTMAFDALTDAINTNEIEMIPSGGSSWDAYGSYLIPINEDVKGGYSGQYKTVGFEAEEGLIESYFNVRNLRRDSFKFEREGFDREEVQNDNEEYDAVQKELYG